LIVAAPLRICAQLTAPDSKSSLNNGGPFGGLVTGAGGGAAGAWTGAGVCASTLPTKARTASVASETGCLIMMP